MSFLFDFEQPKSAGIAVLFYIAHLVIVVALAAVLGLALINPFVSSIRIGQIFAFAYSTMLCVLVINQRHLNAKYYGTLVIAVPAAALLGGLGGLVVPAFLTTRDA